MEKMFLRIVGSIEDLHGATPWRRHSWKWPLLQHDVPTVHSANNALPAPVTACPHYKTYLHKNAFRTLEH
jgi:hypothetical protein